MSADLHPKHTILREQSSLAWRALDASARVLETITGEDHEESELLKKLRAQVDDAARGLFMALQPEGSFPDNGMPIIEADPGAIQALPAEAQEPVFYPLHLSGSGWTFSVQSRPVAKILRTGVMPEIGQVVDALSQTGAPAWLVAVVMVMIDVAEAADAKGEPKSEAESVRIPATEDEASLMVLLGINWLRDHAPHRLTKTPA